MGVAKELDTTEQLSMHGGRGEELVPDSASKIHIPWEKRKRTWCFSA